MGGRYKVANVLTPNHEGVDPREAKETRANAHLIAAAPELLDALQKLLKYHDDFYGIEPDEDPDHPLSVAKAAIAKALGQQ
ncbi:hypothetical protein [Providencia sp. PROV131]|uniref:hypothetical protein n=1 Tax=Providencia sp. PROV131 TaxID=2949841 RepID=UPI002349C20D|nr:hypothetical protein [Providencia sp. PROV131]